MVTFSDLKCAASNPVFYIQFFYFQLVLAFATYYLAIAGYLRSQTLELNFSESKREESEERKMLLSEKERGKLKSWLKEYRLM